jgi:YD repeat-containing protein
MLLRRHRLLLVLFSLLLGIHVLVPRSESQGTNYSVLLNGTSSYVDVPYNASLNITGALTIEAWVKTSSNTQQMVLERGDWWQNQMSYELSVGEGKVRLDIMQTGGSYVACIGSTVMNNGAWHHIAAVYDGSQMRVYLDGVLDGSATATMTPGNNSTGLRIGKSSFLYYPNYFNGRIDEVRISNAALYTGNFTPAVHLTATSSTKGLWKFDGQTANDSSGSGAHGSLQGSAQYSTDVPTGPNNPPVITLSDPQNNTNFAAGSNVVIDASASDSDGSVAKVEFFQGATLLGTDLTAPYTLVWSNVAAGSYAISARATDDVGTTTNTTPITITVNQAGGDRSVLFNGTSSYVDVPYNANLNITGALTIEAWVKTSSNTQQMVLERGDWWQNQMSYELSIGEGKVRLDIMQTGGSYVACIGSTVMNNGAWHHIAAVYDGSQMRVYLDGVLDGSATATMTPGNNSTGLRIGKSSFLYYPNYFNGRIDEVRVSNAALYTSNFSPSAHLTALSSTKGLWKFDGETTNDSSVSAANGSLQGGATYSTDVPASGGAQVPVAVANGPYTVQLGQTVTFSSSGSFDPDGTISSYHWNFGDGASANLQNPSHVYQTSGSFTATLTVTDNAGLRASTTATVTINGANEARLDPRNQTGGGGENALSQNFNWSLPLLSLPGRSGMDLGLMLSYNSLVWTKNTSGNYVSFDDDRGFPGPGFHLGFPVIQPIYFNSEVGKYAFLLIAPDGSRTELRQVGTSAFYEAADSSHLLLDTTTMTVRTSNGTQLSYVWMNSEYNCTQIKDRNGNYITINYTPFGRIDTVVDTLARSIKFNYDANGLLTSITQIWNQGVQNQLTHNWAVFTYGDTLINTNFAGLTVYGPANNSNIKTLSKVALADGSHTDFGYTSWGQVWKVSNFAPNNDLLNYRAYNLPLLATGSQDDCPRFTERRDWAKYWNGDTDGTPVSTEEAVTGFAGPVSDSWTMPDGTTASGKRVEVTSPDGTLNKIYFEGATGTSSAWRRGLPALVVTYSGGVWQRKVMTTWTQDNTAVVYPLNPRVTETNIYDPSGNRARTRITYQHQDLPNNMGCELPRDVFEYAANATTILRSTRTVYNMDVLYTNRHILGLVSTRLLYDGEVDNGGTLMSKLAFFYDESGSIDGADAPVQHDNTNYGSTFVAGRGNLSSAKRYDVTDTNVFTTTSSKYNTAGSIVSATDAATHTVMVSYVDSFSDGAPRNTVAYPTMVTDPDGYSSTSKYNFDFGALTRTQTPQPNTTTPNLDGPEQLSIFDSIGRLQQITNLVNNAYTRFEYDPGQLRVDTYTTIQEGLGEAHSFQFTDGAGRVIATAADHNVNTFSARKIVYDVMGRVSKTSNPAETGAGGSPSQWTTTGDDAAAGWIYTEQTYDWKGRPLVITNPSLTSNPAETTTKQFSYSGCGCAGGQVVTVTDEGTIQSDGSLKKRQQKIYADVLGRTIKTEILNWDGTGPNGTGGTVYSATTVTYNARDQVTLVRQFAGPTSSTTFQDTTSTYDGFGRLKTQHQPEQQVDANNSASTDHTTWNYNNDDTVASVVDARGVVTNFTYNARRLPVVIGFNSSSIPASNNVAATADILFTYDALANRTSMSDGSGAVTYHYDQLSRMDWEQRSFAGLPNAGLFRLNYEYNLAGILKKVTDQRSGTSFTETLDKLGRVTTVDGVGLGGAQTQFISQAQYRAWGALKSRTQANTTLSLTYNQRLLPKTYSYGGAQVAYQYHNDGSIKFANELSGLASLKDRAYSYDAAGRMQHAYSGVEARNFVNNTNGGTPDGPYSHAYTFDQWNNLLQDTGRFWSRPVDTQDSYNTSNRNPAWSYDADGDLLSRNESPTTMAPFDPVRYKYDAAGRQVSSTQTRTYQFDVGIITWSFVNSQTFDGDNQLTHYALVRNTISVHVPPGSTTTAEAYLVRSTVLAGRVISEYKSDGTWSKTHVYAGGERLGQQTTAEMGGAQSVLETLDPVTGDGVKVLSNGIGIGQTTMDPGGVNVGTSDPFPPDGSGDADGLPGEELAKEVPALIPLEGYGAMCNLDGLDILCKHIGDSAAVQCANNDCGTRTITVTARSGGHVIDRSTFFAPEYWDGSLDGTYGVNSEWAKTVFARWGGGQIFVNFMMWRGGVDDELFWRKGGGMPGRQGSIAALALRDPQNPPATQERLPFNSCEEFVNWLVDSAGTARRWMANGRHRSAFIAARIYGSDLAEIAYFGYERHIHNDFEGFKSELVDAGAGSPEGRQGAGVYGHILFSAGTMLIQKSGDPGGWVAHQGNSLKDWYQAYRGSSQYQSERAGNIAGRAVGAHLWNALRNNLNRGQLTNNIRRELCDGGN